MGAQDADASRAACMFLFSFFCTLLMLDELTTHNIAILENNKTDDKKKVQETTRCTMEKAASLRLPKLVQTILYA